MNKSPNVTTLAGFKRFLAEPGATVQVIRNDWMDPEKTSHPLTAKPGYFDAKQVKQVQSSNVQFTTGSWLAFGKAKNVRFYADQAIFCMDQNGTFLNQLVYRLSYQPASVLQPEVGQEVSK